MGLSATTPEARRTIALIVIAVAVAVIAVIVAFRPFGSASHHVSSVSGSDPLVATHHGDPHAVDFRPVLAVTISPPGSKCGRTPPVTHDIRGQFASTSEPPATTPATTEATTAPPITDPIPSGTTVPGGATVLPSADGKLCYTVGPIGFDAAALERAGAALSQNGQWAVNVNVRPADQAQADDLFNACFAGAPTCPGESTTGAGSSENGAVAIVRRGAVISAPAVNAQDLARAQFQITGQFSAADARGLVAAIID